MDHTGYRSPLSSRYATKEMQYVFSDENRFRTWRKLWIALAKAEKELGLDISDEQIAELEAHQDDINYDVAEKREAVVRHDVMSHIYAYGQQCPKAKGIIHLGATSCYVGDNTDMIQIREGLQILEKKLVNILAALSDFAIRYKDLPTLGYTHFQPAQPTTVGKRAALWLQDFLEDYQDLDTLRTNLKLLGCKGTTGTQASFLELFDGDVNKVEALDPLIARQMGFAKTVAVSGQTYSRRTDARVLSTISGLAQSAWKMCTDIRLLQHEQELEEPFESSQVGSSAMAYKRNPMRCERVCGLCRYVIAESENAAYTAGTQWLERSLDDSSNRRLSLSETFLTMDGILNLVLNIVRGLKVYPAVIRQHLDLELPFIATENIMMEAVKKGADRQDIHERIREYSMAVTRGIKEEGKKNDLLERIAADPAFHLSREELNDLLDPVKFVGIAPRQTERFVDEEVRPVIEKHADWLHEKADVHL